MTGDGPDETADEAAPGPQPITPGGRLDRRLEIVEAVVLAVAAVMTAWAGFESTKWGGVQADSYSRASAARVESTRASTTAGQLTAIDVDTFIAWVDALSAEEAAGVETGLDGEGGYDPAPDALSSFFYQRFRADFRPAVDDWIATRPLAEADAPPTPFAMDSYEQPEQTRSDELVQEAEDLSADARAANQNGDNYVFMAIMFALALVLAGLGSKMDSLRARGFLLGLGVTVLVTATVVLLTFPIEI